MRRVVLYSSGLGSWGAALRVRERFPDDDLDLLFCDTKIEDEDNYRFLPEGAEAVGGNLITIADGRTPHEVFIASRFLGNTRVDPCSRILKRELTRKWFKANCEPESTVVYVGIDWTEQHRFDRMLPLWLPWTIEAPLCEAPFVTKDVVKARLASFGVAPPRMYAMGFAHANCGGYCVKSGQGNFKLLLDNFPARYREREAEEQELRDYLGKDVAIMRDRTGGKTRPLTMREFRERLEEGDTGQLDLFEGGGCSCFAGPPDPNLLEGEA